MSKQTGETNYTGGIGVLGLLGVVFVTLKLTGFIDWSWWYVTAPFCGGFAFAGGILLVALVIAGALDGIRIYKQRQRNKIRKGY